MRTILLAAALALGAVVEASAADLRGVWLTETRNLEVQIAPCGEALCGAVAKVLGNRSMAANAQMAAPPARLGMQILTDLRERKPGVWVGKIYNRENGKTYDCQISLATPDRMALRAFVGLPVFGKSQVWTRVG